MAASLMNFNFVAVQVSDLIVAFCVFFFFFIFLFVCLFVYLFLCFFFLRNQAATFKRNCMFWNGFQNR